VQHEGDPFGGGSVSRTTSSARPTDSPTRASCSGSTGLLAVGRRTYQPEARPGELGAPRGPVKPFALIAGTLAARPGLAALGRSRSCRKSSFYSIIPPCPRKAPARAPPPAERHARHGDHIEPKSLGSRVQASTAQSRSPPRRGIEDSKGRIALDP
jgi:hypothetical protein